eukprot:507005-Karenia_brevis.AAC.1
MSMYDMLQTAGIHMQQEPPQEGGGRPNVPGGIGQGHHKAKKDWGIRLIDQKWQSGPGGLMSVGDMFRAA